MTDQDRDTLQDDAPRFPTRRELVTAVAAAVSAAATWNEASATSPAVAVAPDGGTLVGDVRPVTEGFFVVISGKDQFEDRVFFLNSSWLPFFEITDLYFDPDPHSNPHTRKNALVQKIKNKVDDLESPGGGSKKRKWHVLYSDDIPGSLVATNPGTVNYLKPPPDGKTYLAMSIDDTKPL